MKTSDEIDELKIIFMTGVFVFCFFSVLYFFYQPPLIAFLLLLPFWAVPSFLLFLISFFDKF